MNKSLYVHLPCNKTSFIAIAFDFMWLIFFSLFGNLREKSQYVILRYCGVGKLLYFKEQFSNEAFLMSVLFGDFILIVLGFWDKFLQPTFKLWAIKFFWHWFVFRDRLGNKILSRINNQGCLKNAINISKTFPFNFKWICLLETI